MEEVEKIREIVSEIDNLIIALSNMKPDSYKLERYNNEQARIRLARAFRNFKRKDIASFEKILKKIRKQINSQKPKKQPKNEHEKKL